MEVVFFLTGYVVMAALALYFIYWIIKSGFSKKKPTEKKETEYDYWTKNARV